MVAAILGGVLFEEDILPFWDPGAHFYKWVYFKGVFSSWGKGIQTKIKMLSLWYFFFSYYYFIVVKYTQYKMYHFSHF